MGFPTKSPQIQITGRWCWLSEDRIHFISELGIHPLAFVHHDDLKVLRNGEVSENLKAYREVLENSDDAEVKTLVESLEKGLWAYPDKRGLFIDKLKEGVGLICAAFYPRPVLVRLSDFKSNEYRELLGGWIFEPIEENPMIAWRGASRYMDDKFRSAFEMELDAMKSVKDEFGLDNLQLMVPFCRTPKRAEW